MARVRYKYHPIKQKSGPRLSDGVRIPESIGRMLFFYGLLAHRLYFNLFLGRLSQRFNLRNGLGKFDDKLKLIEPAVIPGETGTSLVAIVKISTVCFYSYQGGSIVNIPYEIIVTIIKYNFPSINNISSHYTVNSSPGQ